jgi:hypothetical protein
MAPDFLPEGIDGPDGFCTQMGFEVCEGHLDRIKVRTVRRQEKNPGASGPDGLLGGLALWAAKLSMMTMSPLSRAGASSFST